MYKGRLFIIVAVMLFSLNLDAAPAWKENFYKKFTPSKFFKYPCAKKEISISAIDSNLVSASLFYAINFYRQKHNLGMLKYSKALRSASYTHAYHMVKEKFYSSASPVPGFESLEIRILNHAEFKGRASELLAIEYALDYDAATPFKKIGENTFATTSGELIKPRTYTSFALKVVSGWYNSLKHRKVLLSKDFSFCGAGAWFYYLDNGLLASKVSATFAYRVLN